MYKGQQVNFLKVLAANNIYSLNFCLKFYVRVHLFPKIDLVYLKATNARNTARNKTFYSII